MSRTLPSLPPWPAGKPLPAGGITILYDPATNKEYRIDLSRLGGADGGTPYHTGIYAARASGVQTITSAELPSLDTAALIVSVGVRGVDGQGTPTLEPLPSTSYSLAGGILTVAADADIDKDDVLEVQWLTAGQLAAANLSAAQLANLLVAGDGVTITPTGNGKLLLTATTVTAVPKAPAAPTAGQVNDSTKEFTFKVNPAYPSYAQYKENGRPGTTAPAYLSTATAYQVGDTVHVTGLAGAGKQSLAYYVAGSGNVPDGQALTNSEAFTGAAVTPPVTPDAPFPSFDAATRTLTYNHALGTSELEINYLGGSYQPYAPVSVDNSSHNAGEWKARVKAYVAGNRNASGSADSPAIAAKAVNQLPVANAGQDVTIAAGTTSVALMGSGTDAEGPIASYRWEFLAGPQGAPAVTGLPATTKNVLVSGLGAGAYQFELTVTDSDGATNSDFVIVTVAAAATVKNIRPIFVGNSIFTDGYGPGWQQRCCNKLQALVKASGSTATVLSPVSFSVGGENVAGMTSHINAVQAAYDPAVVNLVLAGTEPFNEFIPYASTTTAQQGVDRLNAYFAALKSGGYNFIITTNNGFTNHFRDSSNPPRPDFEQTSAQVVSLLQGLLANGTANFNVLTVVDPIFNPDDVQQSADGCHPTAYGYSYGNIETRVAEGGAQALFGRPQSAAVPRPTPPPSSDADLLSGAQYVEFPTSNGIGVINHVQAGNNQDPNRQGLGTQGVSNLGLAAGTDGDFAAEFDRQNAYATIVAFSENNALSIYNNGDNFKVGFYIGTDLRLCLVESGVVTQTQDFISYADGTYFRLKRVSGVFYLEKTLDYGKTWAWFWTYAYQSSGKMYIKFDGLNGALLVHFQGVGLSTV